MFRLVHISDLHLSPLPPLSWQQLMSKRVTGYLNWKFYRKSKTGTRIFDRLIHDLQQQKPDHIVISGDIVNLSLDAEFSRAQKRIARIGSPEDISLVPGNHDAYIPGAFVKACHAFAPWITDDAIPDRHIGFPYMRVRKQVAIIGASSAIAMPPFSAAGYFDLRQALDMKRLLQKAGDFGLFRVVMIHHPPLYHATGWNKRLWGIRRFQHVISTCGAELILHGHTHLPTLSWISGKDNKVPVVGVASASQDFGGRNPPAGYNIFEIGKNSAGGLSCSLIRRSVLDCDNNIGVFMQKDLFS